MIDDIVLLHFVDGSAASLYGRGKWDASIPEGRRLEGSTDQEQTGETAESTDPAGDSSEGSDPPKPESVSMLDVFYGFYNKHQDGSHDKRKSPEELAHEADLRQIVADREDHIDGPMYGEGRQRCGILPNVETAHQGRALIGRWDAWGGDRDPGEPGRSEL